jgi:fatty acid desaturase (delta-4 desaturase)
MTTGFYLAFFFLISHNFQGAHIQEDTTRPSNKNGKKNSYLYKQISSSSNVGGWWLAQLNGGLNYQIEHHLFPRMNHIHYTKIAPVVKCVFFVFTFFGDPLSHGLKTYC